MIVRLSNTLACAGLLGLAAAAPLPAQAWDTVPPNRIVIIQGRITGSKTIWATYQNGVFSQDSYVNDYFKVPLRRTLVIVAADLIAEGDTRTHIDLEIRVSQGKFPLARAALRNESGRPHFTASRCFPLGLVVPERSQSGLAGLVSVAIADPLEKAQYEVLLYGYYTD